MSSSPSPNATAVAIRAYKEASATRTMRGAPRFGHTDRFSALFSDDSSQQEDYLNGLVFIGSFVVASFIIWIVILLLLKCLGRNRVGFFSGAPMQKKSDVVDYNRPFRVRFAFCNAAIIFITFSVLLVVNGLTNLQDTVISVSDSNEEVNAVLGDASVIVRNLNEVGKSSGVIRDELVATLGNFCPDSDVTNVTGQDFDQMAGEAVTLLNELGDFINSNVARVQDGIDRTRETTMDIEDTVHDIDVNDWQSLVVVIPFVLLPSFLLVGVLMAWFNASIGFYTCLLSWLILPLFIIATIVAIISCASTAYLAVANADFCSGGINQTPDGTVMEILRRQNFTQQDIVFQAVEYYVNECKPEDPWQFIRDYQTRVVDADKTVSQLNGAFDSVGVSRLNLICGKDFGPLVSLIQTMDGNLNVLETSANSAIQLLSCERILPIYTTAVYGATCDYSITGVTWTFASLLVLATMGMIMVTLRSAYFEVEDEYVMGSVDMYAEQEDAFPQKVEFQQEQPQPLSRAASEEDIERVYIDEDDDNSSKSNNSNNRNSDNEQPSSPHNARAY